MGITNTFIDQQELQYAMMNQMQNNIYNQGMQGMMGSLGLAQQAVYPGQVWSNGSYPISPIPPAEKREATNLEWLDERIKEMRVKL